jgi:hypothetical protein
VTTNNAWSITKKLHVHFIQQKKKKIHTKESLVLTNLTRESLMPSWARMAGGTEAWVINALQ